MTCNKCNYYNKHLNICEDKECFTNKKGDIVCRFSPGAVLFKEIYKIKHMQIDKD